MSAQVHVGNAGLGALGDQAALHRVDLGGIAGRPRARQPGAWSNPARGHHPVVPLEEYENHQGHIGRD
jgi:hypothetical protein